jgi:hypothetical protein
MSNEAIRFWSVAAASFAIAYVAVFLRPAPAVPGLVMVATPLILALIVTGPRIATALLLSTGCMGATVMAATGATHHKWFSDHIETEPSFFLAFLVGYIVLVVPVVTVYAAAHAVRALRQDSAGPPREAPHAQ